MGDLQGLESELQSMADELELEERTTREGLNDGSNNEEEDDEGVNEGDVLKDVIQVLMFAEIHKLGRDLVLIRLALAKVRCSLSIWSGLLTHFPTIAPQAFIRYHPLVNYSLARLEGTSRQTQPHSSYCST